MKSAIYLSDFKKIFEFLDIFFTEVPISNLTEVRPVLAMQTHTDGRMDMTKLNGAFGDYIIALKKNFSSAIRPDQLCGPA